MTWMQRCGLLAVLAAVALAGSGGPATAAKKKAKLPATAKACLKNGWKTLLRAETTTGFKSQASCVSYVAERRKSKTLTLNDLRATPNPMDFTAIEVVQRITLTNAGTRGISINSILVGSPGDITNFSCGALLAPRGTCFIDVKLTSLTGNSAFFGKPLVSILYSRNGLERNTTIPLNPPAA